jgi:hypothetical protein
VAFAVVVGGLITYFVVSRAFLVSVPFRLRSFYSLRLTSLAEDQETVDLDALEYVERRHAGTKAEAPDV